MVALVQALAPTGLSQPRAASTWGAGVTRRLRISARARLWVPASGVLLTAGLLLAPAAWARPAFVAQFALRASNGYRMWVFAVRPSPRKLAAGRARAPSRNATVDVILLRPLPEGG